MREIAMYLDGQWQVPIMDGHSAVTTSTGDTVDQIVTLLGQIVLLAQDLSPEDQRRARDFVHACSSVLSATTVLPRSDQKLFETALRNAAAGK